MIARTRPQVLALGDCATSLAHSPKKMVEFRPIAMLGEICSVKTGNVFGE